MSQRLSLGLTALTQYWFYWFLSEPPRLVSEACTILSISERTDRGRPKAIHRISTRPDWVFFFVLLNGSVSAVWMWIHCWSFVYCDLIHCGHTGWINVLLWFQHKATENAQTAASSFGSALRVKRWWFYVCGCDVSQVKFTSVTVKDQLCWRVFQLSVVSKLASL